MLRSSALSLSSQWWRKRTLVPLRQTWYLLGIWSVFDIFIHSLLPIIRRTYGAIPRASPTYVIPGKAGAKQHTRCIQNVKAILEREATVMKG